MMITVKNVVVLGIICSIVYIFHESFKVTFGETIYLFDIILLLALLVLFVSETDNNKKKEKFGSIVSQNMLSSQNAIVLENYKFEKLSDNNNQNLIGQIKGTNYRLCALPGYNGSIPLEPCDGSNDGPSCSLAPISDSQCQNRAQWVLNNKTNYPNCNINDIESAKRYLGCREGYCPGNNCNEFPSLCQNNSPQGQNSSSSNDQSSTNTTPSTPDIDITPDPNLRPLSQSECNARANWVFNNKNEYVNCGINSIEDAKNYLGCREGYCPKSNCNKFSSTCKHQQNSQSNNSESSGEPNPVSPTVPSCSYSNDVIKSINQSPVINVKLLNYNLWAYKNCPNPGKMQQLINLIGEGKYDFITTQENEGGCEGTFFNKIKVMGYANINSLGDANLFYSTKKWKNIYNCRIPMTYNDNKCGGSGERNSLIGVFQETSTGKLVIVATGHLCICWPCGNTTTCCIGGQHDGHRNDFRKIISQVKGIRGDLNKKFQISPNNIPAYVIGDFNLAPEEKTKIKQIIEENGFKVSGEDIGIQKIPFDYAFSTNDGFRNPPILKYRNANNDPGWSDHRGFEASWSF